VAAVQVSIALFLNQVNKFILNPIIALAFAAAFLIFLYGVFEFISKAGEDKGRDEGKKKITWGLVGMFIMFSAYGIIHVILGTFGIQNPGTYLRF
jgi:hypothetical protein